MFKKVISATLIISFIVSQSSSFLVYLNFKINQDYISQNLCENKDDSMCGGICHLSKQLKELEEKEKKEAPVETRQKSEIFFCKDWSLINESDFTFKIIKDSIFPKYNNLTSHDFIHDIFHPPQIS